MSAMQILEILNLVMKLAQSAGLNWQKYKAAKDKADAEGRELTHEELEAALDDSQAAIDRLRQP